MNTVTKVSPTMVPISGRVPEDLYQWLATVSLEGATTLSDKLRVAVSTLKRIHEGDSDYAGALALFRDMSRNTRENISALEQSHGHSEVIATIAEHAPVLNAMLTSAQVRTLEHGRKLEEQLVRRSLQLTEALLRQAITSQASAFKPAVIRDNAHRIIELLRVLDACMPQGDDHE